MSLLDEAKKIVNNCVEEDSWLIVDLGRAKLLVDNLTDTPVKMYMDNGRIFDIVEVKKNEWFIFNIDNDCKFIINIFFINNLLLYYKI